MTAWALFCHDFDLSKGINILSEKCPVVLDHYIQSFQSLGYKKSLWDKFFLMTRQIGYRMGIHRWKLCPRDQHQVELEVVRQEQLAAHEVVQLQKYTWSSTRTDIQLILKSLAGGPRRSNRTATD